MPAPPSSVIAASALQHVIAAAALEHIGQAVAGQYVVARAADHVLDVADRVLGDPADRHGDICPPFSVTATAAVLSL